MWAWRRQTRCVVKEPDVTVETWTPGMPERECGGCTMCCKLPAAPELNKPAWQWCHHCDKGQGCRIYEARPQGCRDFMCLWKVMPDFPEELRPDRCKVIWTMTEDGRKTVATTEYPDALKSRLHRWVIEQFVALGISVVVADPAHGARTLNVRK
jgi:hypothetical protein